VREKISICGSGLMGSGIAVIFLTSGHPTTIYAVEESEERVREKVQTILEYLVEKELLSISVKNIALSHLFVSGDIQDVVANADVIFECIPEKMEMKQNLFQTLDELCDPSVILATNTSVMSVTEIAALSNHKERIVGTHFWNPAYLIPLVEVVKTINTSEHVMEKTMSLLQNVGKHPIRVNKDVPGFVANRLQHALWREAIHLIESGITDAETVDAAIKYSFAMRLPVLGPIGNADLVGTDLTYDIHEYVLKYLNNSPEPSKLLKHMVEENQLGVKSGSGFLPWTEEKRKETERNLFDHLVKLARESEKSKVKK
jgi:3-hydroxybutyryl-CoA dehydrogenase